MDTLFFSQGILAILLWIVVTVILLFEKKIPKFLKKHLIKRKKFFTFFAVFAIFMGWAGLEKIFSENTTLIVWTVYSILFLVFIIWSAKVIWQDHVRIQGAIKRRLRKEGK